MNTRIDDYVGENATDSSTDPPGEDDERSLPDVPPVTDDTSLSETCLSFRISGPWGHFRRTEGNVIKQTYRLPPRTTVSGMIAAMIGYPRDSYYQHFTTDRSAIAITPVPGQSNRAEGEVPRTENMPQNVLETFTTDFKKRTSKDGIQVGVPKTKERKQHNFEMLVDPGYRIDVRLANDEVYDHLKTALSERRFAYPVAIGKAKCLATVDEFGEYAVEEAPAGDAPHDITSALPGTPRTVVPTAETDVRTERSPEAFKNRPAQGRELLGMVDWCYAATGGPLRVSEPVALLEDADRRVVFS